MSRSPSSPVLRHIPIRDAGVRLHIFTHLVASLQDPDPGWLQALATAGFGVEVLEQLRRMPLEEALLVTAQHCGLAIELDSEQLQQQLLSFDRLRTDRRLYEYFVRAGASSRLTSRLFGVSRAEVRRLRALLLPQSRAGGRPKAAPEDVCEQIVQSWHALSGEPSERQRLYRTHQRHPGVSMSAIELALARARDGQSPF